MFTFYSTITDANEAWSHEATKIASVCLYQFAIVNKWKQSSTQKLNNFIFSYNDWFVEKKSLTTLTWTMLWIEIKITIKVQNQPLIAGSRLLFWTLNCWLTTILKERLYFLARERLIVMLFLLLLVVIIDYTLFFL